MTRCTAFIAAPLALLVACGGRVTRPLPIDASPEESRGIDEASVTDGTVEDGNLKAGAADGAREATLMADSNPGADALDAGGDALFGETGGPCSNEATPPSTLACTGLYADITTKTVADDVHFYQPAVPLWSDGAEKKRWIWLPPGSKIDASHPSEWLFPVGTKLWKEFSRNGKRIETRLFQKVDNGPPPIWVHTTYAWNADESAAFPSGGGDIPLDGDGGTYHIPTFSECEKCHNGRTDHILGFEQVSLGLPDAQGLTLSELAAEGLITPVPALRPVIGDDGTGEAAPALAWLHINCGVPCHNSNSNSTAYGVGMLLRLDPTMLDGRPVTSDFDPLRTTIGVPAHSTQWLQPVHWTRIEPGDPSHSLLVQLISNRGTNNPVKGQMPPIASSIVDTDDVAKVVEWVSKLPQAQPIDAGADANAPSDAATTSE